jgi:hypothetical protein
MDIDLANFIKNVNVKLNLKQAIKDLEFTQQNDMYYYKEIEGKNVHVKFEQDEMTMWLSGDTKKYTKYYKSLRSEKDRGLYTELEYINETINLIIKGGN